MKFIAQWSEHLSYCLATNFLLAKNLYIFTTPNTDEDLSVMAHE